MKDRHGVKRRALFHVTKVLWHLDIFRRGFRELSGHSCMAESCIFCALKELFGQLQFSHERALPPDALRKALAQSFSDQHRFQLGFMDDAAECFENMLLRIHYHIASNEAEDMCNAKHCIPHQKFAMTLVEQSVCGACNATSEPLPFTQMVHYVSASALISQSKQIGSLSHKDLFGQLLKKAGGMGDIRDCPSSCGAKIQIRRTLMNRPEIVSVGIVWDSDRPSLDHIMSLLDTLRTHLRLSEVFHGYFDSALGDNVYHELVGVVTYYGKHYSTFFFHTKLRVWVYFDDANVREVGPHWEQVVEKCRRGRYQPLLLLFAVPNGTPIDTSNAPQLISQASKLSLGLCNGHNLVSKSPTGRMALSPSRASLSPSNIIVGGRRSITPNPEKSRNCGDITQRRAVTPNPELVPQNYPEKSLVSDNDYQNLGHFREMIFQKHNQMGQIEQDERQDGITNYSIPNKGNELVRRDSGNWSGDRNSASSSSSTSLENPYQYIMGKNYRGYHKNSMSIKQGHVSNGGVIATDAGYDSFSLSSTDSLPLQHSLKHNLQLAQIPEGHQTPISSHRLSSSCNQLINHSDECERLCAEADQLLDRSELAEDLETAISLCNAAANRARAAMDAPYSNPQAASFARMKHNACIMKSRSLHRKLEELHNIKHGEGKHTREGSGCSNRSSHSRQNSRDKTHHSRQNSEEILSPVIPAQIEPIMPQMINEKQSPSKNIEIYATLPKSKKGLLSRASKVKSVVEDEEYLMPERQSRSLLSNRSKSSTKKEVEKRAKSEERSKCSKEITLPLKDTLKTKETGKPVVNKEEKQNKKQHKIRRKLLMGGLIRRKNRSMPDLREEDTKETTKLGFKDDSEIGAKVTQKSINTCLSETNLELAGNPNLERSKLMRKSFYSSKLAQLHKVPPPPPLRTTSQLSKGDRQPMPIPETNQSWREEAISLPFIPNDYNNARKTDSITYANGGVLLHQGNTVVTEAQIHHDASFQSLPPVMNQEFPCVMNKVDDLTFALPPYPSPGNSAMHSRQPSEEFPPPPAMAQSNENYIDSMSYKNYKASEMPMNDSGREKWVRELQVKQAERNSLGMKPLDHRVPVSPNMESKSNSVRDLKSKFEQINVGKDEVDNCIGNYGEIGEGVRTPFRPGVQEPASNHDSRTAERPIVEKSNFDAHEPKRKSYKKKSVTFCEQVVLVATAEDREDDSYIPNPILERVLRSVLHKDGKDGNEVRESSVQSIVPLKRTDSWRLSQGLPLKPYHPEPTDVVDGIDTSKISSTAEFNTTSQNNPVRKFTPTYHDTIQSESSPYNQCFSPPQTKPVEPSINSNNIEYDPKYINRISNQSHQVMENSPNLDRSSNTSENVVNNYNAPQIPTRNNEGPMNSNSIYQHRSSPMCVARESLSPNLHQQPMTSNSYQTLPNSSYQPMSLQYYHHTQGIRSSPQIHPDHMYDRKEHRRNLDATIYPYEKTCYPEQTNHQQSHQNSPVPINKQINTSGHCRSSALNEAGNCRPPALNETGNNCRPSALNETSYSRPSPFNEIGNCRSTTLNETGNCRPSPLNETSHCRPSPFNETGNVRPTTLNEPSHCRPSPLNDTANCRPSPVNETGNCRPSPLNESIHCRPSTLSEAKNLNLNSSIPQNSYLDQRTYSNNSRTSDPIRQTPIATQDHRYSLLNHSTPSSYSEAINRSLHTTPTYHQQSPATGGNCQNSYSPNTSTSTVHHQIPKQQYNQYPGNAQNTAWKHSPYQPVPHPQYDSYNPEIPIQSYNGLPSAGQYTSNPIQNKTRSSPYQSIPSNSQACSSLSNHCTPNSHPTAPVEINSQQLPNTSYHSVSQPPYKPSNNYTVVPQRNTQNISSPVYQHPPSSVSSKQSYGPYQRVPTPNHQQQHQLKIAENQPIKYSPYQNPPIPKQVVNPYNRNSLERTPSTSTVTIPCNLCRKKQISPPSAYCLDCNYYMSRFKQKV